VNGSATAVQAGLANSPFVQAPNLKPLTVPATGGGMASAKRRPSDPNFKTSNVEKMLNPGSQMYLAPYRVVLGDVRQKVRGGGLWFWWLLRLLVAVVV
jgi:hypothetical protein